MTVWVCDQQDTEMESKKKRDYRFCSRDVGYLT